MSAKSRRALSTPAFGRGEANSRRGGVGARDGAGVVDANVADVDGAAVLGGSIVVVNTDVDVCGAVDAEAGGSVFCVAPTEVVDGIVSCISVTSGGSDCSMSCPHPINFNNKKIAKTLCLCLLIKFLIGLLMVDVLFFSIMLIITYYPEIPKSFMLCATIILPPSILSANSWRLS
jgi:hypothetical protein